jgi:hypothetical protein
VNGVSEWMKLMNGMNGSRQNAWIQSHSLSTNLEIQKIPQKYKKINEEITG